MNKNQIINKNLKMIILSTIINKIIKDKLNQNFKFNHEYQK